MLVREHTTKIIAGDTTYVVWICAEERTERTWSAWIEFHPTDISQPILRTEQESSQPNLAATEYWADGLEPIYLEGALARRPGAAALVDSMAFSKTGAGKNLTASSSAVAISPLD